MASRHDLSHSRGEKLKKNKIQSIAVHDYLIRTEVVTFYSNLEVTFKHGKK